MFRVELIVGKLSHAVHRRVPDYAVTIEAAQAVFYRRFGLEVVDGVPSSRRGSSSPRRNDGETARILEPAHAAVVEGRLAEEMLDADADARPCCRVLPYDFVA
jgi:hypothetical protein